MYFPVAPEAPRGVTPSRGISGLADPSAPWSPFREWARAAFPNGNDWDTAVYALYKRVAWNRSCFGAADNTPGCLPRSQVESVVSAYIQLVLTGKVKEVDVPQDTYYATIAPRLKAISELSKIKENDVSQVLYELYYGTKDGSIGTQYLLYPTRKAYKDYSTGGGTTGTGKGSDYPAPTVPGAPPGTPPAGAGWSASTWIIVAAIALATGVVIYTMETT